jgi:hypothetical protein
MSSDRGRDTVDFHTFSDACAKCQRSNRHCASGDAHGSHLGVNREKWILPGFHLSPTPTLIES